MLEPEVELGVLDRPLLDAVSGLRRDRRKYGKQVHSKRRARHLLEAAADLAHELARGRGRETGGVEHARAELVRLRAR
ncbi:hypothetical protein [Lentzea sp.]|uniref:hypothetical protein n=1 Tax=Lentzea sp. TaxID=56099 RepID=UPI002ED4E22D